jgi:hypothetical protein
MEEFKDYSNIPGNTIFDLRNVNSNKIRKYIKPTKIVKKCIIETLLEEAELFRKFKRLGEKSMIIQNDVIYDYVYPENTITIDEYIIINARKELIRHHIFYINDNLVPEIITDSNPPVTSKDIEIIQEELRKKYTLYDNEEFHV